MKFHARVPVRIDFLGGITDCPPFSDEHEGAVLNAGISRYIYATLELTNDKNICLTSKDFNSSVEALNVDALELDGNLDLMKVCLKRFTLDTGFKLTTYSDVPPGSGLGSSASLTIAILAVLKQALGQSITPHEMASLAFAVEREDLGTFGGSQDQFGAALGGINYLTFHGKDVGIQQLAGRFTTSSIAPSTIFELQKRLLLVYTGSSHVSSDILRDMQKSYYQPESETKEAMHKLKELADKGKAALFKGDLETFASLINENWYWHKKLHASCGSPELEELYKLATENGAISGKTCGAGGGGCIVFYCKDGERATLRKLLEKQYSQTANQPQYNILDFVFDYEGLQVWQT